MARVNLSGMPNPPKEYVIDFPRLDGGLNTLELDYRLDADESPEMKNLWWQDGALCSRDGQVMLEHGKPGVGYSAYERLFWGNGFFHIGDKLYRASLASVDTTNNSIELIELVGGVPENRGCWFQYSDCLYYKNKGGYIRISYDSNGGFSAGAVPTYSPIILIDTEPTTAAGDMYQPENRIDPQKTVWYSTVAGVKEYRLPVQNVDSVDKVVVDDIEITDYTADLAKGTVTFATEPTHHNPVVSNSVKITYTKANPDAYNSIMDCPFATTFGGSQSVCVVVGGCDAQPNAYFWNGNHSVMDPGYFPITQYNLAGASAESITGFGNQQSMLVIFKEHSVGRAAIDTTTMDSGRVLISMDYVPINDKIGCDLPGSIQLVQNNLVFCDTRQGVHVLKDSSAAYENNIIGISQKVDNDLLKLIQHAKNVTSFDDGNRYWLVADGEVYAWDYSLSTYSDPSWFYFDNIHATDFITSDAGEHYHLGNNGSLTAMQRNFMDYGGSIDKVYRFATQNMGSYDKLKNIVGVLFSVRGDTDTDIDVEYVTDYERRKDLTPIRSWSWRLNRRNLTYRTLNVVYFATSVRRKPNCRNVRHFTMTLRNNEPGMDMSVLSARVMYTLQGRDR